MIVIKRYSSWLVMILMISTHHSRTIHFGEIDKRIFNYTLVFYKSEAFVNLSDKLFSSCNTIFHIGIGFNDWKHDAA